MSVIKVDWQRLRSETARRVADALAAALVSSGHYLEDCARKRLLGGEVWHAPVLNYDDVIGFVQVKMNGVTGHFEGPEWEASYVRHPVMYDGALPELRSAPPHLGEHAREILRQIGVSDDEIERPIGQQVVRSA